MKKLLVTLLILGIAAGVFAQTTITISADFNPELMRIGSPSGELAKKEVRGSSGTVDMLSSSGDGTLGQQNELRVRFDWAGEAFSARLNINADSLIRYTTGSNTAQPIYNSTVNPVTSGTSPTAPDAYLNASSLSYYSNNFVNGTGKTPTLSSFLNSGLEGWYLKGSTGVISGFIGTDNSDARGKTLRFQGAFDNYTKGKIDNYGLMTPVTAGTYGYTTTTLIPSAYEAGQSTDPILATFTDASRTAGYEAATGRVPGYRVTDNDNNHIAKRFDLGFNSGSGAYRPTNSNTEYPHWAATLSFKELVDVPLFLTVAGDIGYNVFSTSSTTKDYSKMNGSVRVSGEKLGNIITFDAIYKFRGGDPDTYDDQTNSYTKSRGALGAEPDAQGAAFHSFGLYTNLFVVENLGIGVGYTGAFRTYEDRKEIAGTTTYSAPYFQGFDLRFQFTGVPNLTITFNNAFTFAFAEGTTAANQRVLGVDGSWLGTSGARTETQSEQAWYALYNALAINYKLSDPLTLNFGVANRLGMLNKEKIGPEGAADREEKYRTIQLGATVNAAYKFNSFVMMQGGLQFLYDTASYSWKSNTTNESHDAGMMYFAIPIRLQVVY
jgi:hypothetical protein